jgi:hypothetical protein
MPDRIHGIERYAMIDKPTANLSRRNAIATAISGLALLGYVGFLLYTNFHAAAGLQDLLREKVLQETERRASALGYFFGERKDDLQNLTLSREVSVYFDNQAKGIYLSEKADLRFIKTSFQALMDRKRLDGVAIYRRIVFLDPAGVPWSTPPRKLRGRGMHSSRRSWTRTCITAES